MIQLLSDSNVMLSFLSVHIVHNIFLTLYLSFVFV